MKFKRIFLFLILFSFVSANGDVKFSSRELKQGQAIKAQFPNATPSEIGDKIQITKVQKALLKWMLTDLESYLANFDKFFEAKLQRISEHHVQRVTDLEIRLAPLRERLKHDPNNKALKFEISRLSSEYKPQGFVQEYSNAQDFVDKFVGAKGKILKTAPSINEIGKMDLPGVKTLYVDTWNVPFFNTATQSREEAKSGVKAILDVFKSIDFRGPISFKKFTELTALFARPEFDDLRRYKLVLFPSAKDQVRFKGERSDALIAGNNFPTESFAFIKEKLDLDPLSYSFGSRIHAVGIISHGSRSLADGRLFTGPADWLEHDLAHAFFNLSISFPGTPEDWIKIHEEFFAKMRSELDAGKRKMMSIVYFHLTHESGYRFLLQDEPIYQNLVHDIREKIQTRYYYDWIPDLPEFEGDYEKYLDPVFNEVSFFFREKFRVLQFKAKNANSCHALF